MTDTLDREPAGGRRAPTSVHLDYGEPVLGYHLILAELAAELAPPGGAVADLGCGPGQILGRLAELRPDLRLVGLDSDAECLRRAAARAPSAELVQTDLESVDGLERALDGDRRFDVIVSSHALEHLASPVEIMQRWGAKLAEGGRLVIAVPNSVQPLLLARALVRRPKANAGHYFVWDRATFENFCRLAGFSVEATVADYVPLVPVRVRVRFPVVAAVERALVRPLPQFSNSHIVVLALGDAASG